MIRIVLILCICLTKLFALPGPEAFLREHDQLIVVTTSDWEQTKATVKLYERENGSWVQVDESMAAVLGKHGVAWGIGLHPKVQGPCKKEGDKKSPLGVFSIGPVFGFEPEKNVKMDYLPLNKYIEAVDDNHSRYYNCIVDNRLVPCDWNSSEHMRSFPVYKIGFVINHNYPNPRKKAGSAIFFHIWQGRDSSTNGCTAMSEENLEKVLSWLDQDKNPALLQLTELQYSNLRKEWHLP